MDDTVYEYLNMTDLFDKGIMPFPGSYTDQPSKFVDIVHLVHNLRAEQNQKDQEKLKKHGRK